MAAKSILIIPKIFNKYFNIISEREANNYSEIVSEENFSPKQNHKATTYLDREMWEKVYSSNLVDKIIPTYYYSSKILESAETGLNKVRYVKNDEIEIKEFNNGGFVYEMNLSLDIINDYYIYGTYNNIYYRLAQKLTPVGKKLLGLNFLYKINDKKTKIIVTCEHAIFLNDHTNLDDFVMIFDSSIKKNELFQLLEEKECFKILDAKTSLNPLVENMLLNNEKRLSLGSNIYIDDTLLNKKLIKELKSYEDYVKIGEWKYISKDFSTVLNKDESLSEKVVRRTIIFAEIYGMKKSPIKDYLSSNLNYEYKLHFDFKNYVLRIEYRLILGKFFNSYDKKTRKIIGDNYERDIIITNNYMNDFFLKYNNHHINTYQVENTNEVNLKDILKIINDELSEGNKYSHISIINTELYNKNYVNENTLYIYDNRIIKLMREKFHLDFDNIFSSRLVSLIKFNQIHITKENRNIAINYYKSLYKNDLIKTTVNSMPTGLGKTASIIDCYFDVIKQIVEFKRERNGAINPYSIEEYLKNYSDLMKSKYFYISLTRKLLLQSFSSLFNNDNRWEYLWENREYYSNELFLSIYVRFPKEGESKKEYSSLMKEKGRSEEEIEFLYNEKENNTNFYKYMMYALKSSYIYRMVNERDEINEDLYNKISNNTITFFCVQHTLEYLPLFKNMEKDFKLNFTLDDCLNYTENIFLYWNYSTIVGLLTDANPKLDKVYWKLRKSIRDIDKKLSIRESVKELHSYIYSMSSNEKKKLEMRMKKLAYSSFSSKSTIKSKVISNFSTVNQYNTINSSCLLDTEYNRYSTLDSMQIFFEQEQWFIPNSESMNIYKDKYNYLISNYLIEKFIWDTPFMELAENYNNIDYKTLTFNNCCLHLSIYELLYNLNNSRVHILDANFNESIFSKKITQNISKEELYRFNYEEIENEKFSTNSYKVLVNEDISFTKNGISEEDSYLLKIIANKNKDKTINIGSLFLNELGITVNEDTGEPLVVSSIKLKGDNSKTDYEYINFLPTIYNVFSSQRISHFMYGDKNSYKEINIKSFLEGFIQNCNRPKRNINSFNKSLQINIIQNSDISEAVIKFLINKGCKNIEVVNSLDDFVKEHERYEIISDFSLDKKGIKLIDNKLIIDNSISLENLFYDKLTDDTTKKRRKFREKLYAYSVYKMMTSGIISEYDLANGHPLTFTIQKLKSLVKIRNDKKDFIRMDCLFDIVPLLKSSRLVFSIADKSDFDRVCNYTKLQIRGFSMYNIDLIKYKLIKFILE